MTQAKSAHLGIEDIRAAAARIAGIARRTPVKRSEGLSGELGLPVWLKLDTEQPTGAFKIRGAANRLLRMTADERARGVVTVSSGNHGRAVAYVARELGMTATIVVSRLVPANKLDAIRELGAELVVAGESQDESTAEMLSRAERDGSVVVSPFDDLDVIAGQGTVALELFEQVAEPRTIVVPLSGGGLLSGVAVAAKALCPDVRIVGVTMAHGPAMYESLRAGRPVDVEEVATLADALGGGIGLDNRYTFDIVRSLVDDTVLVTEGRIGAAMRRLYHEDGVLAEGGASVGVAALTAGLVEPRTDGPVVVIVSGRNVDDAVFRAWIGDRADPDAVG